MTDTIKAIETSYAGCRFRSRLEARWAVFFDHLGVKWLYEPQGFELPSGERYLPDFQLPDHRLWVEVKGDEEEMRKHEARYAEAAMLLDGNGLLILGPVPDLRFGMPMHFVIARHPHCCGEQVLCLHIAWRDMITNAAGVAEYGFACTDLISHEPARLPALKGYNRGRASYTDPGPIDDWPIGDIDKAAYQAARSARFEHGERG